MQFFRTILLALWQLPQTIVGLLVLLLQARRLHYAGDGVWGVEGWTAGVCFGEIIMLRTWYDGRDLAHERGHRKQSRILGPLYLLLVGLPSAVGNLIDRWLHKDRGALERNIWYYTLPWEEDADKRGGVNRWH